MRIVDHHDRAAGAINERLERDETLVVAGPSLIEAYSVLTRMPPPRRLSPSAALGLLTPNFLSERIETIVLPAEAYHSLILGAPARGIAGGRIYDAVIVACALAGRVDTLLTFNERHFRSLVDGSIQIVVP